MVTLERWEYHRNITYCEYFFSTPESTDWFLEEQIDKGKLRLQGQAL